MNFSSEWNKIVMNALSVLVATVIVGAACIVWERAAGAEKKIEDNTKNLTALIETLTEKLSLYEVQITTMSNQLSVLIHNQDKLITQSQKQTPVTGFVSPKSAAPDPETLQLQQRAVSGDMMRQFTLPRK